MLASNAASAQFWRIGWNWLCYLAWPFDALFARISCNTYLESLKHVDQPWVGFVAGFWLCTKFYCSALWHGILRKERSLFPTLTLSLDLKHPLKKARRSKGAQGERIFWANRSCDSNFFVTLCTVCLLPPQYFIPSYGPVYIYNKTRMPLDMDGRLKGVFSKS